MTMILAVAAILLFLMAARTDMAARRIPNRLTGLLALVAVVRIALEIAGGGLAGPALDAALALGVFALGAGLFQLGVFGGGDVKLLAAGALWLGAGALPTFLAVTALAGGALAVAFLLRMAILAPGTAARPILPYGVAIAAGGVLVTLSAL